MASGRVPNTVRVLRGTAVILLLDGLVRVGHKGPGRRAETGLVDGPGARASGGWVRACSLGPSSKRLSIAQKI